MRKPFCYFAALDAAEERYILLLEDFPQHRPGDEIAGCCVADARLAVVEMARLHGAYWNAADKLNLPSFPAYDPGRHAAAWDTMIAQFGDFIPLEVQAVKDAFFESLPRLDAWINSKPTCVIHGDMKVDNLLFGPTGAADPIVVLDWQGVRESKGVTDFAYLVTQNMTTEDRRSCESELMELYVNTLRENGVVYDLAAFKEDYRRAMLLLLVVVVAITGLMINTHERAIRRKRGLVQRTSAALLDWDALSLLPFRP